MRVPVRARSSFQFRLDWLVTSCPFLYKNNSTMTSQKSVQRRDLQEVVSEWRQTEHAESTQGMLWMIFKAAFASPESDEWSPIMRSNVCFLYERLHDLMHDLDPEHATAKFKKLHEL